MKVYFEDGMLNDRTAWNLDRELQSVIEVLDASYGISTTKNVLDTLNPDSVVYTNSLIAFNNKYAWNETLGVPEVYVRGGYSDWCWTRIDELTDRELCEGHNLAKLYLAGEFGELD